MTWAVRGTILFAALGIIVGVVVGCALGDAESILYVAIIGAAAGGALGLT